MTRLVTLAAILFAGLALAACNSVLTNGSGQPTPAATPLSVPTVAAEATPASTSPATSAQTAQATTSIPNPAPTVKTTAPAASPTAGRTNVPAATSPSSASPTPATGPTLGSPTPAAQSSGSTTCNRDTFVTDVSIPDRTVVTPGQAFSKTWRVRNDGSCAWASGYQLAFVSGQSMSTAAFVAVPDTAPNATVDVSVPMTAPTAGGLKQSYWRMRAPNGVFFGPSLWAMVVVKAAPPNATGPAPAPTLPSSGTLTPSASTCDRATFVADVTVPDKTSFAPSQGFSKTWRMRNTGTCTWGSGYQFAFVNGQSISTVSNIPVPNTAPNATVDLVVPMVAPGTPGAHQGFWRLMSPSGAPFGPTVWVLINVTGATATPTP